MNLLNVDLKHTSEKKFNLFMKSYSGEDYTIKVELENNLSKTQMNNLEYEICNLLDALQDDEDVEELQLENITYETGAKLQIKQIKHDNMVMLNVKSIK